MSGGEKASSTCPNCHSSDYWRDGIRKTGKGIVQRYVCRSCGYRFSESSVLLADSGNSVSRQVCAVLTEVAINLAEVEPSNGGLVGVTEQTISDTKGTIIEFAMWLKKQGFAESTIITRVKLLKILSKRGAELLKFRIDESSYR
ncbi:MAG: Site-specific integrase [Thermoproteota archaeon]|nr:Site-specific integrase [Thermoproteota archaeon]